MKTNIVSSSVYLFARFSSIGQTDGDSEARQIRNAKTWCQNRNKTLSEPYFIDRGVSAKEGKNRDKGTEFYKLLFIVKPGDTILIEDNDRFGRDGYKGLTELQRIITEKQISVVMLSTGLEITAENFENMDVLVPNFFKAMLAKEENEKKGKRVREAFAARRQRILNGEVVKHTKNGTSLKKIAGWIDGDKWAVNSKGETVKSIFKMYLDGLGAAFICRKLNQGNVKTLGELTRHGKETKWGQSVIYRLLQDRRVIGEYTNKDGSIIPNYYPPVIDRETFLRLQAKFADNKGKIQAYTKSETVLNIFQGVAVCSCCNRLIKVDKGYKNHYVSCWGKKAGICNTKGTIIYSEFEATFAMILNLHPEYFLKGEQTIDQTQVLRGRLAEIEKQIEVLTKDVDQMAKAGMSTMRIQIQIADRDTQINEIKKQIDLEAAKTVQNVGGSDRLDEIRKRLVNLSTDKEIRLQVQGFIRESVNQISVDRINKTFSVDLKSGHFLKIGMGEEIKILECKTSYQSLFSGIEEPIKKVQRFINV